MRKWNTVKTLSIISLVVSVVGLLVAYLTMRNYLSKTEEVLWNIKFSNLSAVKDGEANYILPSISDTSLRDSKVSFVTSDDSVTFVFDVENLGTIDAVLGTIFKGDLKCTGTGENAVSDAKKVCDNIQYTLKYDDGANVSANDLLNKKNHRTMKLMLKSKVSPISRVTVTGFDLMMIYHQNS